VSVTDTEARRRLAFPLDYDDLEAARRGAIAVAPSVGVLKIGLELFVKEGPASVRIGHELDRDVFLDLKLHDIPATVEAAVASAASLGVKYLTVHAFGGPEMIERAVRRAEREAHDLTILAVTVLTSLSAEDLSKLSIAVSPGDQAVRLAKMAHDAGAGGFVCSPMEVAALRRAVGPEAVIVTPGIRPAGSGMDDQKRVGTPRDAIRAGATILVVGRPIREAQNPSIAARGVLDEISQAAREATS
jgi:orotidine-5'-phosphate decarboxylase